MQSKGGELPPGQKAPTGQGRPGVGEVEPAGQKEPGREAQAPLHAALLRPGLLPYLPLGQAVQELTLAPSLGWKLPAAQAVQAVGMPP